MRLERAVTLAPTALSSGSGGQRGEVFGDAPVQAGMRMQRHRSPGGTSYSIVVRHVEQLSSIDACFMASRAGARCMTMLELQLQRGTNAAPSIRSWVSSDIPDIARIFAAGWRQAGASFMPEAVLAARGDPERRTRQITRWLANEFDETREALFVAQTGSDEVCGLIVVRLGRGARRGTTGFVPLLYVDPALQRRGIGAALLLAGVDWLKARGAGALAISAFERNPYRGFYDGIGGVVAKAVTARVDGYPCKVLKYHWPSIDAIRARVHARVQA